MNCPDTAHKVNICIPPALAEQAFSMQREDLHPVWKKFHRRGRHFVVSAESLDDLSELADFARVELEEPDGPLTKVKRAAYQALLHRTHRHAVLEPLGDSHCLAVAWRDVPLRSGKNASFIVRQLREESGSQFLLSRGSRTTALTAGRKENGR